MYQAGSSMMCRKTGQEFQDKQNKTKLKHEEPSRENLLKTIKYTVLAIRTILSGGKQKNVRISY